MPCPPAWWRGSTPTPRSRTNRRFIHRVHPRTGGKPSGAIQELRLTAEQSGQINEIVQASIARLKGDKEDLDRAQSDFRALMERPSASERELLKAAERLEMARYSISKERTTMLVRIHSVLTPDQRRGLDAIAKRHEAERNRKK